MTVPTRAGRWATGWPPRCRCSPCAAAMALRSAATTISYGRPGKCWRRTGSCSSCPRPPPCTARAISPRSARCLTTPPWSCSAPQGRTHRPPSARPATSRGRLSTAGWPIRGSDRTKRTDYEGVDVIERDDQDEIAVVRLAHGPVNALDLELVTAITETSNHRAVVFTGTGRAFTAGVDLWRIVDGGPEYIERYLPALSESFGAVFTIGKPVVGALNGHAIAGGCILASGCDYRIMSAGRIGVPEFLVGVPFPMSGLEILTNAVGEQRARQLALTGATHEAPEALELGLVDELAPADRLLETALATAHRLAAITPPDTFRLTKHLLRLAATERLARHRATEDPQTLRLWQARAADGTVRSYMERAVTRR